MIEKIGNNMMVVHILQRFANIDTSGYPDFDNYKNTLDRALWVLWVADEKLGIKGLTSEQISHIILKTQKFNIKKKSISMSLSGAGNLIYKYYDKNGLNHYEIMKPGIDFLKSKIREDIKLSYFEAGKQYTSKKLFKNILENLKGELRIVDPYASERTLDILFNIKNSVVKFLTRVDNLTVSNRNRFLRNLQEFKPEKPKIEFRNYTGADVHDRYIISSESLIILGHSIKDLGSKESFAIKLDNKLIKEIFEDLSNKFNRRWKTSDPIP